MALLHGAHMDDAYANGLALAGAGDHAGAIRCFETALKRTPNDTKVLFALGNTARAVGHAGAAEKFYRRVLASDPGRIEALVNLANLMGADGRAADAVALLEGALELSPRSPELRLTLGSAMRSTGDAAGAEEQYREALRLRHDYPQALGNLADLIADRGELDEALRLYDRVVKGAPHDAQARLNRAVLRLLCGELKRGWRDYEYRLKIAGKAPRYTHGLRIWNGKKLPQGARLLVAAEQGIGDQIQFASLIPELAQRLAAQGGKIILEADPRLVPVFARSFAGVSVHGAVIETAGGTPTARYEWLSAAGGADRAIPLASLAAILRQRIADFPRDHAYLKTDETERERWRQWLGETPGPHIGICWRSGNMAGLRAVQFAPLEVWADFLRRCAGDFVSLQYDGTPDEIAALERMSGKKIRVPPELDQKLELDRAAALMAGLDAAISAPTAVSWLSAGAGVPTFKILYNNSWTAFGEEYEPFAPSCHCIMPKSPGDWRDGFAQACGAIKRLSG